MGKQWVREQVRKDLVQDSLDKGVRWVEINRSRAGAIAAGVAAAALIAVFVIARVRANKNEAWDRLSIAEAMAYTGRVDGSLEQLKKLSDEQPGTPAAAYGQLFAGDVLYTKGQYKEALALYTEVLERGAPAPLMPIALNDVAISQEAVGEFAQAQQTAQRFLDSHPDHFLAPQVHAVLARAQAAQGQLDAAKATYQKIALQYPETSWAAWASARLSPAK
jgi:tetratricopeptide (TPR) repeat protein